LRAFGSKRNCAQPTGRSGLAAPSSRDCWKWKHKELQGLTKWHEPLPESTKRVGRAIIGAAIAVHRALGPGLLESAYEICLAHELKRRGNAALRQMAVPVVYEAVKLEAGYRVDLMVTASWSWR